MIGRSFEHKIKIYYQDTDCEGVVYYANYLTYLERSRMECLEELGFDLKKLKEKGILFVVASVDIRYLLPAYLADILLLKTYITKVGVASLNFYCEIYNKSLLINKSNVTLVCIDDNFKPQPLTEQLRDKFKECLQ